MTDPPAKGKRGEKERVPTKLRMPGITELPALDLSQNIFLRGGKKK